MTNHKKLQAAIEAIAGEFHKLIYPENANYTDLGHYFERIGVVVRYAEIPDADGYLRYDADLESPVIVVRAYIGKEKQRYAMAHLLGRLALHRGWLPARENNLPVEVLAVYNRQEVKKKKKFSLLEFLKFKKSKIESVDKSSMDRKAINEADTFARAFLLPRFLIEDSIKSLDKRKNEDCVRMYDTLKILGNKHRVCSETVIRRVRDFTI